MYLALLFAQHESLERALTRSADLDRELEVLVREAVRLGARGGPADEDRARAALAAIDPARRAAEFRQRIVTGGGAGRRFVLSEVAAWRDRAFLRPVLGVFLTADDAADRRAARETIRALADDTLVERLAEALDSPASDASLRRALELAGEFGDARLAGRLAPRLGPAVRSLEEFRAAGGLADPLTADRTAELERMVILLVAALRRSSGRDFGSDWRAWEGWARDLR